MAKVIPSLAFDNFSGKLGRKDRIILRTRYGKTHAYTIENPYTGPATEAQNTMRSTFGMAVKQASAILKDPEQKADWERRYFSYRKHYRTSSSSRYYSTLRGFIIATLNAELKSGSKTFVPYHGYYPFRLRPRQGAKAPLLRAFCCL